MKLGLNSWTKAVIWLTGIALTLAVEGKFFTDRKQAESNFKWECGQELHKSSENVATRFHALFADLRTIARMPAVRNSHLSSSFIADDWADVRELYASMAESTPVRVVRIVPIKSSWAGPTVDTFPLSNRVPESNGFEKLARSSHQLYLIGEEMAHMPLTNAGWDWRVLQDYPAYTCRPMWMRISEGAYAKTFSDFVTYYSVPIYSQNGRLWGSISAELPYSTLTTLVPNGNYSLTNASDGITVSGAGNHQIMPSLLYVDKIPVPIEDRMGRWYLEYKAPLAAFEKRPDMRSAQQFRWVAHAIVAAITIAAFFFFSSLYNRRSELEEAKTSLENRVLARTTELAEAAQEAKNASRIKGEFLANMSHEIRTPMNGVIAMTEMLLESRLDDEQKDLAETIASSANSLLTIINDVLDFSKIEARKLLLEQTQFNLASLFEDIVKLHAAAAMAKGLEILAELDPSTERIVEGDPVRIRQIASNLLGNAIKFTTHGSVILTAKIVSEGRNNFKFSVKDTGVGIPPNRIDAIFESFTQSDASTTRKYGGTGLGLTISRHLAELMGGHIGVHSKLGKGSEFFVNVQLREASRVERVAPVPNLFPKRVLICDDFEPALNVYASQLLSVGHFVTKSSSAKETLELLRSKDVLPFDVLIVDQTLPERDGIELCREIKKSKLAKKAKIILITASPGGLAEGAISGTDIAQTLAKPVRKESLVRAVEMVRVEQEEAPEPNVAPAAPTEPLVQDAAWLRILLVEDNVVNQKVAKKILGNLGCSVTVANDGAEAILMDLRQFDIVFMDCQMPRLDGLSATRQIRHRELRTGDHALIVALTANAMEEDRQNCLQAGMDEYMAKPLRQQPLQDVLERLSKILNAA
jgi:signal transduction histidine kinase/DNA-binding response OmpR family regulator